MSDQYLNYTICLQDNLDLEKTNFYPQVLDNMWKLLHYVESCVSISDISAKLLDFKI